MQDWDDYLSQVKLLQGENKSMYQLGSTSSDRLKVLCSQKNCQENLFTFFTPGENFIL